jgi:hypothetical protein
MECERADSVFSWLEAWSTTWFPTRRVSVVLRAPHVLLPEPATCAVHGGVDQTDVRPRRGGSCQPVVPGQLPL